MNPVLTFRSNPGNTQVPLVAEHEGKQVFLANPDPKYKAGVPYTCEVVGRGASYLRVRILEAVPAPKAAAAPDDMAELRRKVADHGDQLKLITAQVEMLHDSTSGDRPAVDVGPILGELEALRRGTVSRADVEAMLAGAKTPEQALRDIRLLREDVNALNAKPTASKAEVEGIKSRLDKALANIASQEDLKAIREQVAKIPAATPINVESLRIQIISALKEEKTKDLKLLHDAVLVEAKKGAEQVAKEIARKTAAGVTRDEVGEIAKGHIESAVAPLRIALANQSKAHATSPQPSVILDSNGVPNQVSLESPEKPTDKDVATVILHRLYRHKLWGKSYRDMGHLRKGPLRPISDEQFKRVIGILKANRLVIAHKHGECLSLDPSNVAQVYVMLGASKDEAESAALEHETSMAAQPITMTVLEESLHEYVAKDVHDRQLQDLRDRITRIDQAQGQANQAGTVDAVSRRMANDLQGQVRGLQGKVTRLEAGVNGDWVSRRDYDALAARLNKAEAVIDAVNADLHKLEDFFSRLGEAGHLMREAKDAKELATLISAKAGHPELFSAAPIPAIPTAA